jgi:hypothetical protein
MPTSLLSHPSKPNYPSYYFTKFGSTHYPAPLIRSVWNVFTLITAIPIAVWCGVVYNTIYCRPPACFADFICHCCHLWMSYMVPKVLWEIFLTLIHARWFDLDGYDSTGISKPWSSNKSKVIWYTRSEFPRWVLSKILRDAPNKALGWRPSPK